MAVAGQLRGSVFRNRNETTLSPKVFPTLERENALLARGYPTVIGCDEVGRGPLAGPVVVGLVVWNSGVTSWPEGLCDSKAVTEKRRPEMALAIRDTFPLVAIGEASALEIDESGIVRALATAVIRGLRSLASQGVSVGSSVLLLDGTHDFVTPRLPHPLAVVTQAKADRDCVSVAAASVIAKVHRDTQMVEHAKQYPQYGFEGNKGYGSASHREAIVEHGLTPLHRATWIHFS